MLYKKRYRRALSTDSRGCVTFHRAQVYILPPGSPRITQGGASEVTHVFHFFRVYIVLKISDSRERTKTPVFNMDTALEVFRWERKLKRLWSNPRAMLLILWPTMCFTPWDGRGHDNGTGERIPLCCGAACRRGG